MIKKRLVLATYENGALKLQRKLPLPNHTTVRLFFGWPNSVTKRTRGLLRTSPRVAHIVVDSDKFSALNS